MKILAQINPNSGSDYHRKLIPLQYLKADFVEELTTEIVKNYEVLYINRNCKISAASLSIWKELGLKIIYDLDDSLEIPSNYPNAKIHANANPVVRDKLFLADWVIVSTNDLYQEVKKYNPNITIIPNRLDYKNIKIKQETKEEFLNRKIRIGFVGAFTHYQDWKSIKGWMNSLVNHGLFKRECEFVMLGYDKSTHQYWQEFANLGKFAQAKPPKDYLRLFHEIDIILCPLLDNQLNKAKSSLRVLECGVGNCIPILSNLYKQKTDIPKIPDLFYVNKDKEWLNIPLELISDKENLWEIKTKTGEQIRKIEFQPVVEKRQETIYKVLSMKSDRLRYLIYSVKYNSSQLTEYIPYLNPIKTVEEKSYLFEYNPMMKIIPTIPDTYESFVGVFSWKFPLKTKLFKRKLQKIMDENQNYDCINFCKPLDQPYLKFTEKVHPGFMELFTLVCKDLDLPVSEPKYTIYSNFFVLKANLYKEYLEVLKQAIISLDKYKDLAWRDANYTSGNPNLKELTGLDYYTFHTFILERLIGQWIDKNKIKTLNYI